MSLTPLERQMQSRMRRRYGAKRAPPSATATHRSPYACTHWLPDASRRDVDRLDTLQQSASLAHPEDRIDDPAIGAKFFGLSGEPNVRQLEPYQWMAQAA
jgi:hypothetical protein